MVGSVNSNRRNCELALDDIGKIDQRFGGILKEMFTHRYPLEAYQPAFAPQEPGQIKIVIEVEPWN